MKVEIIGAGMVGGAIEHCFAEAHDLYVHDPARGTSLSDAIDHVDMVHRRSDTLIRKRSMRHKHR